MGLAAQAVLKPGREKSLLRRHPWVFSGAIAESMEAHAIAAGEIVRVISSRGEVLGCGFYSPGSLLRVRMLAFGSQVLTDESGEELIRRLVREAVARGQNHTQNEGQRLINAENDFLPGVVADRYARWVVCQFTSAGAERWKNVIAEAILAALPFCEGVAERPDADARKREGLPCAPFAVLKGTEPPELIEFAEGPVKFLVDPRGGHKTGFYLDQRDARECVASFANGRDVLNCFSYSGGFGIRAALAGAKSVTQVDSSADALALARKIEALNPSAATFDYVCDDVFKFLRKCRDSRRTWDLIVLDPPKFAETKSQLSRAARGYKDINLLAMKLLRPGGILATFSCSGAMSPEFFDTILSEAATDAALNFQIIARTGHAIDHPVALPFPEGRYLKGVLLRRV